MWMGRNRVQWYDCHSANARRMNTTGLRNNLLPVTKNFR
jgi:hypothetical protein